MFRGSDATHDGYLTPTQLRTNAWKRVRHDLYVDSRVEVDHELRIRAAVQRLPSGLIVAGPSAAVLLGVDSAARDGDPIHLIAPSTMRVGNRAGTIIHRWAIGVADVQVTDDMACTSAVRTAWDLSRWFPPTMAVPILDVLLQRGLVSRNDLARLVTERGHERAGRLAQATFELVDPAAQSPRESLVRVRLVVAGLPKPTCQLPVVLPNGVTVHPDMAWKEYRVACEYDGLWHADSDQLHRDRRRLNGLVSAGWIVLHVTSERLRTDFDGVVAEIKRALMSRGWKP